MPTGRTRSRVVGCRGSPTAWSKAVTFWEKKLKYLKKNRQARHSPTPPHSAARRKAVFRVCCTAKAASQLTTVVNRISTMSSGFQLI